MSDTNDMHTEWVTGRYSGPEAKRILAMAGAGIGYFITNQPDVGEGWVEAAFLRPVDNYRPDYLQPVNNPHTLDKLNRLRKDRLGLH